MRTRKRSWNKLQMKLKQTKKNPEEFEEMLLKTSQYKAAQ